MTLTMRNRYIEDEDTESNDIVNLQTKYTTHVISNDLNFLFRIFIWRKKKVSAIEDNFFSFLVISMLRTMSK